MTSGTCARPGPCRAGLVVPAAGAGRRMGGVRKPFLELAGVPVLLRAIRPFLETPGVEWVVIALPAEAAARPPWWLAQADPRVRIVAGGPSRGASVAIALAALPSEAEVVLVHDGARPLVSRSLVERCLAAAAQGHSVVAGVPVVDTLKEVDERGRIVHSPPRGRYWQAQTPQAFSRTRLEQAYRRARAEGFEATDDAALVERFFGEVAMIEGSAHNLKITRPEDLVVAERMVEFMESGGILRTEDVSGARPPDPGSAE